MDQAEKITLVDILDLVRRLINELELNSVPLIALTNVIYEAVEQYNLLFGVKARTLVQQLIYAMADVPGDHLLLARLTSDISVRMDRDHCKTGNQYMSLRYLLPLDSDHLKENPPMRRLTPKHLEEKATQTHGTFGDKPVMALIMKP